LLSLLLNPDTATVDYDSEEVILFDEIEELPDAVAAELDGNGQPSGVPEDNKNLAAETNRQLPSENQTHTNRLLQLFNEFRSFADQACDAVLREVQSADRIEESMEAEIKTLQEQIREKEECLQTRDLALARLAETSNARFAEFESRIQDQESRLKSREIQLQQLASERDFIAGRLSEAELAATQAEGCAKQQLERMEAEFTDLKLELEKREESLGERESTLARHEGELRTNLQNLQLRLRDAESKLASRDRELKQRDNLIDAAAVREMEIGRFIERLSSECEKLSAELCEKRLLIARLQDKTRHSTSGGKVWKKVFGLAHEEVS
jgi:chromosome segregation ATPase